MAFDFVPLTTERESDVRRLLADASLAHEFDVLLAEGQLAHILHDRLAAPEAACLVLENGEPAALSFGIVLPQAGRPPHAVLRFGVAGRFRRRGLGTALLTRACDGFAARADRPSGLDLAAWLPSDAAEPFAMRHGFAYVRTFWRMSRPPRPVTAPAWPDGITFRTFDRSEQAFREWTDIYNSSFAGHWRYVPSPIEQARDIAADPLFLADGLLLASRDGRCVGFCRNDPLGTTGVVATLGVAPEARGIGLGRAMLRWAIGYFEPRGYEKVALIVDGENESALTLYRQEGFTIERTRRIWERDL